MKQKLFLAAFLVGFGLSISYRTTPHAKVFEIWYNYQNDNAENASNTHGGPVETMVLAGTGEAFAIAGAIDAGTAGSLLGPLGGVIGAVVGAGFGYL